MLRPKHPCRGAGHSIDYSTQPLTYYSWAEGVLLLADALSLDRPDVLGWSSGGNVALMLAALHGDRIGRAVALAAMAGSNHTGGRGGQVGRVCGQVGRRLR